MLTTTANQNLTHVFPVSLRLTPEDHTTIEQLFTTLKVKGVCKTKSEFLRLALDELAKRHADVLEVVQ